ncbi:MAG: helix-turn-helix protein [Herbinix sp.]|jgi:AraC-like DNA-binding protein|nr:helix-turn-helix protein [Herbinix sp.]
MGSINFTIIPPKKELSHDVECFRIAEHGGKQGLAIKVCPNGFPGIVFQHSNGKPTIENIVTNSGRVLHMPDTLFIYGQVTELSVMNFKQEPYITVQAILKPHALKTLFGRDASKLTNNSMSSSEFNAEEFNERMISAKSHQEYITLFEKFLQEMKREQQSRDILVEESLQYIQSNISTITVKELLENVYLSERQFEKRFIQTVGITPQFYIRVKRFNEAMRRIDSGQYECLSDVAYSLNYFDQSHFIRDIKVFSGITPKSISQKVNELHHDLIGTSYLS